MIFPPLIGGCPHRHSPEGYRKGRERQRVREEERERESKERKGGGERERKGKEREGGREGKGGKKGRNSRGKEEDEEEGWENRCMTSFVS